MSSAQPKELYEFLVEAELDQYYTQMTSSLKVNTVDQIKYIEDDDLVDIGMTKPEMRRLKRFFKKESEPSALARLKKMLIKGQEDLSTSCTQSNKSPQPEKIVQFDRHVISEDDVSMHRELGRGRFSHVDHGVWNNEGKKVHVAVKYVKKSMIRREITEFVHDFESMTTTFDHKHLAQLFGVVFADDSILIVMELAPQRSLLDVLKDPAVKTNFSVSTLCNLALQICEAMLYLEQQNFVHRDLCARNVLVFSKDCVKVSDYGLTRILGIDADYQHISVDASLSLAVAWCAPECMASHIFSSASDVWAYGVTLWEMFSYGFQPWAGFTSSEIISGIAETSGQRLEQPDRCPKDFYELMTECWLYNPSLRPKFCRLLNSLQAIKPTMLHVNKETSVIRGDCLLCKLGDVVTVLDKRPINPPVSDMWRVVHESSGRVGFFDPLNGANYVEIKSTALPRKPKVSRKESEKKSSSKSSSPRSSKSAVPPRRLHAGMISAPQADLRHTGHVGYDGAMFGDVSFIGQDYERLPVKVHTPQRSIEDVRGSIKSLPTNDATAAENLSLSRLSASSSVIGSQNHEIDIARRSANSLSDSVITPLSLSTTTSQSNVSVTSGLQSVGQVGTSVAVESNEVTCLTISKSNTSIVSETVSRVTSIMSSDTLTDVSSMQTDFDDSTSHFEQQSLDDDCFVDGLDDFRIPELSMSFDLGPSLIDEVMKVIDGAAGMSVPPSGKVPVRQTPRDAPLHNVTLRDEYKATGELASLTDSKPPMLSFSSYESDGTKKTDKIQQQIGQSHLGLNLHPDPTRNSKLSQHPLYLDVHLKPQQPSPVPSSSSSSADLLPGSKRCSASSSNSLPGGNNPARGPIFPSSPFSAGTTCANPLRPNSLVGKEQTEMDSKPRKWLRDANAFSKTKARIRSSVSSVTSAISGGGGSGASGVGGVWGKNSKVSTQPNINVNLSFFDKLREQELEQLAAEIEERRRSCDSNERRDAIEEGNETKLKNNTEAKKKKVPTATLR